MPFFLCKCSSISSSVPKSGPLAEKIAQQNAQIEALQERLHALAPDQLMKIQEEAAKEIPKDPLSAKASATVYFPQSGDPVSFKSTKGFLNDAPTLSLRIGLFYFQSEKYPESIVELKNFLEKFPDHPYADTAQFYLATCFLKTQELSSAQLEFEKLMNAYPYSPRLAESLQVLSQISKTSGQMEQAEYFQAILQGAFPEWSQ